MIVTSLLEVGAQSLDLLYSYLISIRHGPRSMSRHTFTLQSIFLEPADNTDQITFLALRIFNTVFQRLNLRR